MMIRHATALIILLAACNGVQDTPKTTAKGAASDAELARLARELDKADKNEIPVLVSAFAQAHRPTDQAVVVLVSSDKQLCIAIGKNGTEQDPDGHDVALAPIAVEYDIAVGGNGAESVAGNGGSGGTVTFNAKAHGRVILVAGKGGKGADGQQGDHGHASGTGGNGGSAWFGRNFKAGDEAYGGSAGQGGKGIGGQPGGKGGNAGSAGPEPQK